MKALSGGQWRDIITPLLGVPFVWGARGPDSYDCWGVVAAVLSAIGSPVPENWVASDQAGATRIMESESRSPRWRACSSTPGAVVAMSARQAIHHVGIVTPFGILTTSEGLGVVVSPEAALRNQGYKRIEYYQWVG